MASTSAIFRRRHRLVHARQFQAVFGARVRRARGPIAVFAAPNDVGHARLGLSIGRRCGGAVVRNTIKRRLREAFRLLQSELCTVEGGAGFDYVVTANPHEPIGTSEYGAALRWCASKLRADWRQRRSAADAAGTGGAGRAGGDG